MSIPPSVPGAATVSSPPPAVSHPGISQSGVPGADHGVRVWIIDLAAGDPDILSPDERERAARFVDRRAGWRYVAARTQLRRIIAALTGQTPESIRFTYGRYGKPALVGGALHFNPVHFNLGHSRDQAVIAVGPFEVGADIEWAAAGSYQREAARLVMSPAELDSVERSPDPDDRFTALWVGKEAFAKRSGSGLDDHLAAIDLRDGRWGDTRVTHLHTGRPGLHAAVAHPIGTPVTTVPPAPGVG